MSKKTSERKSKKFIHSSKKTNERKEAFMRIVVAIVSGIIIEVWRYLISLFSIINFVYAIFAKKRIKQLSELSEIWNTQHYIFLKYMIFQSNARPFPFTKLAKSISKFEE